MRQHPPPEPAPAADRLAAAYADIDTFSRLCWPERALRAYQLPAAQAIVESVRRADGETLCIVFSRQAGKDELIAQVQAYLLHLHRRVGGAIVHAAPTLRPQALIGRDRLLERLDACRPLAPARAREGRTVAVGRAAAHFLSAGPASQARGATASLLLICNEAQDVAPERWESVFAPMAASTDAPTVFMGTPFSSRSLLARQVAACREREAADGRRRVYLVPWPAVAAEVPAYGAHVRGRIARLGADHPFIRSEYALESIDADGSLFPPARQVHLRGDHPRQRAPTPGRHYALLLDVAGEEEPTDEAGAWLADPSAAPWSAAAAVGSPAHYGRRDATALTVVEVDATGVADPLIGRPTYRVVDRRLWVGAKHADLYAILLHLAGQHWRARWVVVDATGVGAGLASFLARALGPVVRPVIFSARSKSEIGWSFLAAVDAGRVRDYADDGAVETALFWRQVGACTYEVLPGPSRRLRWSVPSATLHDDLLVSAALIGWLDEAEDWRPRLAIGHPREE